MGTDARVEAYAFDDLFAIETMSSGVSVEFVEVRDPHGEIGVGEEFDGFGFCGIGKEDGDGLFDGAFFEEASKDFGALGAFTNNDPGRMQVVVESTAFTQKFWRENEILGVKRFACFYCVANGDGRFNDHGCIRIDSHDVTDNGFNRFGIEVISFRVVVGGCSDDDVVGTLIGFILVESRTQVQRLILEVTSKSLYRGYQAQDDTESV